MAAQGVRAWHFLPDDRRLRWGTRDLVEAGRTYTASGPLVLCENGMHASVRALDALSYAPGAVVCRVELSGEMLHGADKIVARSRRVLWLADATAILHEFALRVATDALCREQAAGRRVDPRSWAALDVKRRWLHGTATMEELAAAWDAAGAAAGDAEVAAGDIAWAAEAAAWVAAGAAAGDAAGVAAGDAARVAAWAARAAAWAAGAAAWVAAGAAAGDAAGVAAWDAARVAYNQQLDTMLESLAP